MRSHVGPAKRDRSRASSTSRCCSSSNAIPSGFHSLIPLYGAGLWDAVMTAPHANSRVPLASVGVETRPASIAGAPEDKTPAMSAWTSIGPVTRGSRPTIVLPYPSPRIIPRWRARSGVTSTFPSPRIPDEPNRRTDRDTTRAIESLWRGGGASLKQPLYSDVRMANAREWERVRRDRMVMEPVSIEAAIEKAKKKGLRPGRVKGTDGIQFTKGRNNRIEVITWDEFRTTLADRQLEVFDSNGFMKIMKRQH